MSVCDLVPAVATLTLMGCVATPTLTAGGKRVRDADEPHVADCQYLGEFNQTAGNSGSTEAAKTRARNSAAQRGATDIVWDKVLWRKRTVEVTGKEYRCP